MSFYAGAANWVSLGKNWPLRLGSDWNHSPQDTSVLPMISRPSRIPTANPDSPMPRTIHRKHRSVHALSGRGPNNEVQMPSLRLSTSPSQKAHTPAYLHPTNDHDRHGTFTYEYPSHVERSHTATEAETRSLTMHKAKPVRQSSGPLHANRNAKPAASRCARQSQSDRFRPFEQASDTRSRPRCGA